MLEIGEDVWGLKEFFNNDVDELVNAFTSAQKEIAPDIELRLQIGLSRHCSISYLEDCLSYFWGNKNFYSIDLYGDELAQPIENFKGIYRRAKKEGLSTFAEYMLFQLMMNSEIAAICFVISAVSKKNRLGIGISVAMLLYVYDLTARVVPDLKEAIFISPFSYSNATSIFARESKDCVALILGTIMIVAMTVGAGMIYAKRDLAS